MNKTKTVKGRKDGRVRYDWAEWTVGMTKRVTHKAAAAARAYGNRRGWTFTQEKQKVNVLLRRVA